MFASRRGKGISTLNAQRSEPDWQTLNVQLAQSEVERWALSVERSAFSFCQGARGANQ